VVARTPREALGIELLKLLQLRGAFLLEFGQPVPDAAEDHAIGIVVAFRALDESGWPPSSCLSARCSARMRS
jgi:hypothetical protein